MSTPQLGMDPDRIERIGRDLQAAAADLERIGGRLGGAVERTTGRWTGPDARMFQDRWHGEQQARLRALVTDIEGLGAVALANADAQRRVSADLGAGGAGTGGAGAGPGGAGAGAGEHRSPKGIKDMLDFEHRGDVDDKDGLRIQVGVGPDGRRKVIVYIAGTGGDDQGRLDLVDNPGAVAGFSQMAAYVRERLAGLVDGDTDLLLIGFSQGGMVAEEVARGSEAGSVTVITEAAPALPGPRGRVDVLRLNSPSALNDLITVPGNGVDGVKRYISPGDYDMQTGVESVHTAVSDRGAYDKIARGMEQFNPARDFDGSVSSLRVPDPIRGTGLIIEGGKAAYADHLDHDLYREAVGHFENSRSEKDVYLQEKIAGFTDIDLAYDSDRRGLDDRSAVAPPPAVGGGGGGGSW